MDGAGFDFAAGEDRDGIRLTWNEWPSSKLDATIASVPVAAVYSPFKLLPAMPAHFEYEPVRCKQAKCGAVLNPFCHVEFMSKQWQCCMCGHRNPFPPLYAEHITETHLPAELYPAHTTVEYQLPGRVTAPPAFLFVLDVAVSDVELGHVKASIVEALSLLPATALVGLMTFGSMVTVHELSSAELPKSFVFRGTRDYDAATVQSLLGLSAASAAATGMAGGGGGGGAGAGAGAGMAAAAGGAGPGAGAGFALPMGNRFLAPVAECGGIIQGILADVTKDPWPCPVDQRPARAVGSALRIAESLLDRTLGKQGARIVMLQGGPCTVGPGTVAERSLVKTMRGHSDITKGTAPLLKEATAFYRDISKSAAANGHAIDLFVCSLDQTGYLEMKSCVTGTGGVVVFSDSFGQSVFAKSFPRIFRRFPEGIAPAPDGSHGGAPAHADAGHMMMGFGGTMEVLTSRDYKLKGALGPCTSLRKPASWVSEHETGEGGTYVWSLGALDPSTSLALLFEIGDKDATAIQPGKRHYLQIITYYQHSNCRYRMRVTTVAGMWSTTSLMKEESAPLTTLAASFDQEAAAVVMGRIAVSNTETEDVNDIMRWLDKSLIRLCGKFGDYRRGDASSFRLAPNFAIYPQFMFHMRRSPFMQVFNSSPDEAAYNRTLFLREDVGNAIVMMQPSLMCYSFGAPPQPVLLDAASVRPDVILLMDSFFHVLIFHGETIAKWKHDGYHERAEHAAFKALLDAPIADAAAILDARFPMPRFIECDQHKSQARFLMARVNPSITDKTLAEGGVAAGMQPVITDDVSYAVFMEHLTKLATEPA